MTPKPPVAKVNLAVRMPPELHERLVDEAEAREVSANWMMNRAIEEFLDRLIPTDELEVDERLMIPHYLNPRDPIFRTYTWAERGRRLRDAALLRLAKHTPRRVRYWMLIDAWSRATTGTNSHKSAGDITVHDMLSTADIDR